MEEPQKPNSNGKKLPPAGLDPLGVTHMLAGDDRVSSFARVPPEFQTPLRDLGEDGLPIQNWCGFYALWLACHYLWPHKWNMETRSPSSARAEEILGLDVPAALAWTVLRLGRAPSYFNQHNACLNVNGTPTTRYLDLALAIIRGWIFRLMPAEEAEDRVITLVRSGAPVILDIPLRGLFAEHAVFVYGVCREGFVVIDSTVVPGLGYRKVTPDGDPRLIMVLPFAEFRRRWGRGAGIWHISVDGAHTQRLVR